MGSRCDTKQHGKTKTSITGIHLPGGTTHHAAAVPAEPFHARKPHLSVLHRNSCEENQCRDPRGCRHVEPLAYRPYGRGRQAPGVLRMGPQVHGQVPERLHGPMGEPLVIRALQRRAVDRQAGRAGEAPVRHVQSRAGRPRRLLRRMARSHHQARQLYKRSDGGQAPERIFRPQERATCNG